MISKIAELEAQEKEGVDGKALTKVSINSYPPKHEDHVVEHQRVK